VPTGSLSQEFFIPGVKFVPGRYWGGKALDKKFLGFYCLFQWCRRRGCRRFKLTPRSFDLLKIRAKFLKLWANSLKIWANSPKIPKSLGKNDTQHC